MSRHYANRSATKALAVLAAAAMWTWVVFAQRTAPANTPVDLSNGPAKPGFDVTRFNPAGNGWFKTFYVSETYPLQRVLDEGKVAADTGVLVTKTADGNLALLMDQMAYHHIAQGNAVNKDWMVSF